MYPQTQNFDISFPLFISSCVLVRVSLWLINLPPFQQDHTLEQTLLHL